MHKYMAQEVTLANEYARGVLKTISQDDARLYVAPKVMAGVLSPMNAGNWRPALNSC